MSHKFGQKACRAAISANNRRIRSPTEIEYVKRQKLANKGTARLKVGTDLDAKSQIPTSNDAHLNPNHLNRPLIRSPSHDHRCQQSARAALSNSLSDRSDRSDRSDPVYRPVGESIVRVTLRIAHLEFLCTGELSNRK